MPSSDADPTRPARRPALVDELERMGFAPADLRAAQREPVVHDEAAATEQLSPLRPPYDQLAALQDDPEPPILPEATPAAASPEPAVREPVPSEHSTAPPSADPGGAGREGSSRSRVARRPAGDPPPHPELTAATVVRGPASAPSGGWRRAVFTGTFGLVRPGPSAAEQRERELVARATRPVPGCWRVAVLSLKGGVGKTTTTAALGVQLATLRGDRVIAVDANPDRGTLVEKVPQPNPATVRDLLQGRQQIRRYSDVRAYTSLSPSRLEVLASDADPTASQAFSEDDYRSALSVLEHFYSVILTDCGTGLLHSAMSGVLGLADSLVLVTSANLDGARSASATLDWLEAHGLGRLVRGSVAVVSSVRPRGGYVDVRAVHEHFAQRCRAVVQVPFDRHLETGSVVDLTAMAAPTRHAYLELAAAVGDGLP